MPHSIKRWLDWAMSDALPFARPRPPRGPAHVRYEKGGLVLAGPPVPWAADAVRVELPLRLPPAARVRTDFTLRLPGRDPVAAEAVRKDDADDRLHRVFFRIPTPAATATAEVLWKHRLLAAVPLPVQTADQFLAALQVVHPTVTVRVGGRAVAARTFVAAQCRGLTAAGVLRSPTGLAPLADLGLAAVFRAERGAADQVVPVALAASQLAAREAVVTASPPAAPRQAGEYVVGWRAGGRSLCTQRLAAVSSARFAQSLRVADARFVAADDPPGKAGAAAGGPRGRPWFVLASREPGAAGLVELTVTPMTAGTAVPPPLVTQTVLVTDGPTAFAPAVGDPAPQWAGYELRHKGRVVGAVSFRPVPSAGFDAEGGFKPPPDFGWTAAAEEELTDRLLKLMRPDG